MTSTQTILDLLKHLAPEAKFETKDFALCGFHAEIEIPENNIRSIAESLKLHEYFLECLTAVDFVECFELVYVFNQYQANARLSIKVVIPKAQDTSTSIHDIHASATWYEREVTDMFGLKFENNNPKRRFILADNADIHPLLKSFKGEPEGTDVEKVNQLLETYNEGYEITYPQSVSDTQDTYHLNLGPQHPSTHGALRVILELKGERVLSADPIIGYVHRNHEKMAEVQEYKGFWPNMGRLDYVGAMSYNFCFAALIEKAMGVTVSERVEYIRIVVTELNRISSHLLWLGTYLLDLGAFTPFFYCFDDREKILDMLEHVTGERLTYDYFRFGGLVNDYPVNKVKPLIETFIPYFRKRLAEYQKLIGDNIIFRKRTQGVGIIKPQVAKAYGVTGPSLRACGFASDIRRAEPYGLYDQCDFDIPTQSAGDAYARYLVRMAEMEQSLRIVEQLHHRIPDGEVQNKKIPRFVPKGEYYFNVESARGAFGMYLVSDGTMNPYRLKLRTPSFSNLSVFGEIARDAFMADLISILGSIDLVIPEIDR